MGRQTWHEGGMPNVSERRIGAKFSNIVGGLSKRWMNPFIRVWFFERLLPHARNG